MTISPRFFIKKPWLLAMQIVTLEEGWKWSCEAQKCMNSTKEYSM